MGLGLGLGLGLGSGLGLEASLSHRGVGCSLRGMDAVTRGERGGLLCLERGGDALRGELSKLGLGLGAFHGGLPCSLS